MPRTARLDTSGVLHHVMARGIERRPIFDSDDDRRDLLTRLERLATSGALTLFAWALLPNHFHLLVRSGSWPLSRSMRSLLSGYASSFNRRHRRAGHLFQNRFKSILCEEEPYFLELVRYIHLNLIRAGLVRGLSALDRFPWSGHSALVGAVPREWQETGEVLARFGRRRKVDEYREFVAKGMGQGSRPELQGGGILRSVGGWEAVRALRRGREAYHTDERILGSPEFVEDVRRQITTDEVDSKVEFGQLASRIAADRKISLEALTSGSRSREVARARRELCWVWCRYLGRSGRELARSLSVAPATVHSAVRIAEESELPGKKRLWALCGEARAESKRK